MLLVLHPLVLGSTCVPPLAPPFAQFKPRARQEQEGSEAPHHYDKDKEDGKRSWVHASKVPA
jgi:hypothetical protein